MQIQIFEGFNMIDMIFSYVSFERLRKYIGAGDFTLTLNDMEHAEHLRINNYLLFGKDCCVIENIHKYVNDKKEELLEITGRHLNSILDRRSISTFNLTTTQTYENQIYALMREQFITPADSNKQIEFMTLSDAKGIKEFPQEDILIENKTVLEILEDICLMCELGFRINFLPEEKLFQFEVYKGRDLTEEVFFSKEYGNVGESELYEQAKDYKNVGYLNNDGILQEVGEARGLERREFIIKGNDILKVKEKLIANKILISAECSILLTEQFEYKTDWDLGDTVSFIEKTLDFTVEKPIFEIKESYSNNLDIDVVFGDRIPTIYEKIIKKVE